MQPIPCAQPSRRLSDQPGWKAGRRRRRPLISLTPLIDVVFILLVFFMLASSFLDWRSIDLNAPGRAGSSQPSMVGAMLVEVRTDGLRLSGESITVDGLETRIAARLEQRPDQRVLVKPAATVPLQQVVTVLDRLSTAGVTDLSLIRDPTP